LLGQPNTGAPKQPRPRAMITETQAFVLKLSPETPGKSFRKETTDRLRQTASLGPKGRPASANRKNSAGLGPKWARRVSLIRKRPFVPAAQGKINKKTARRQHWSEQTHTSEGIERLRQRRNGKTSTDELVKAPHPVYPALRNISVRF
jgi:hypothetical protein